MQVISLSGQYFEAGQDKVIGPFVFKNMAYEIRQVLGTDK